MRPGPRDPGTPGPGPQDRDPRTGTPGPRDPGTPGPGTRDPGPKYPSESSESSEVITPIENKVNNFIRTLRSHNI